VAGPPERGSLVLHAHARTYAGAPTTAGERCRSDGDGSGGCRRAGRRPVPATSAVRWHGTVQESLPPPEKKGGVFRVVPATACSVVPPALAGCGACCLRVLCDSHFTVHTQRRRKLTEPGIKKRIITQFFATALLHCRFLNFNSGIREYLFRKGYEVVEVSRPCRNSGLSEVGANPTQTEEGGGGKPEHNHVASIRRRRRRQDSSVYHSLSTPKSQCSTAVHAYSYQSRPSPSLHNLL
jgi:hypothetical protein